jgi:pyrrolidone-carboxylate peptidase
MSNNAGDYVCNYSMYVMLTEIARRDMKIPFGFIHIPYDCDWQSARRFVQGVLQQGYRRAGKRNEKRRNRTKLSR